MTEVKFISCLVVFKILGLSSRLSEMLQSEKLDISGATSVIQSTKQTLQSIRSDTSWDMLWEEVAALQAKVMSTSSHCQSNDTRPRREHCLPLLLKDSAITAPTKGLRSDSTCEQFKIELYFPSIDHILSEMEAQFSNHNHSLTNVVDSLHPNSKSFLIINT